MALTVTLRDLVTAVADCAQSENEVVATVVHMINSGHVKVRESFVEAQAAFASVRTPASAA